MTTTPACTRHGSAPELRQLLGSWRGLGAGHSACPGCPGPPLIQAALHAARDGAGCQPIVVFARGSLQAATTVFPNNAWRVPYLRAGSEGAVPLAVGISEAVRARRARGELCDGADPKALAFGGGASDFELEAMRGAVARGQDITYIFYHSELPANPAQSRPATPDAGDLARLTIALGVAYAAQASVTRYEDLLTKLFKAVRVRGPSFVNVLSLCPVRMGLSTDELLRAGEAAVDSALWPLYEYDHGQYRVTYRPTILRPVKDYPLLQRRQGGPEDEAFASSRQRAVDVRWRELHDLENDVTPG